MSTFHTVRQLLRAVPAALIGSQGQYDVAGKVVMITGGATGIGFALAELLCERGARLAVVDIDGAAATDAAERLGGDAIGVRADVADRADMRDAIGRVREHFGGIDVVVANAGIVPKPSSIRLMDPANFDRVLAVNLTGVFNTVQPALDDIVAARGHVVVVSSCAAFAPGMGGSPYMVSKAGVEQFGRALRVELAASDATAGVAYFGVVETAMTHDTLDDGDLGAELGDLLPWPLNKRISAADAAASIADGIARRAPRTIAPAGWEPYAMLRGALNVVLDQQLSTDERVRSLTNRLEQRIRVERGRDT
ncbi:NAD(P)-dependent dehydrogenase, short-chain alcohol dehydrogenase family [Nocardia amikacinitolerans]|uniref:NAD(P)-dependent dehydrogenase, short-chain alcohol dehydrogenase family n=1 Tax=Nocardia amikacinitolerans TaxID=756689 RepID=A0A285LUS0_9NOCA|nr:short-chain dehydrogenase/reductase [Nocardia amikacinitolerans]SNY88625.1 NAD(P)-dependent dehydrogenase, short-chain alcohol dehydrogenase family [Nocardia amikacinitolerans]